MRQPSAILFLHTWKVMKKGSKTLIWDWITSHNFIELEKTVFIDDVLLYLKYAEEKGVTAYHISSFIE